MSRIFASVAAATFGVLTGGALSVPVAAAQEKIAYVDLARALEETDDGRKAKGALKKEFDIKQKELSEREEQLKKEIDDFQKKRSLLSADMIQQKETELGKKMQEAQQVLMRHQNALQQKEAEALQPIFDRMRRIVARMSQSENFAMVFDVARTPIVFAKPSLDITNELIRRYNAGEEKGTAPVAKKPAAPGGAKPATPAAPKK